MISLRFLGRLLTAPVAIITAIIKYYTVGTVYQNTNKEFRYSLYKNVHLSVESHLANTFTREDVVAVLYTPVTSMFAKFKSSPLAVGLNAYGEELVDRTYWVHRSKNEGSGKKSVVLFLHGGGYALSVFEAQFVGIMALWYAVPEPKRSKLSVALIDYSLTCHYKKYPTQIHEAMTAYRALVNEGYDNIILVGDSCGTNLASAMARFIAYPEEAREQFSKYTEFAWDFSPLPQPENMVYISPWLEPYTAATPLPGIDTTGDLGAIDGKMGDWYIEGLDRKEVAPFVHFTDDDYATQWSNVSAINGEGRLLFIYGEREKLRYGIEKFVDLVTKKGTGKLEVHVEDGGIHDGLFYVESLDYLTSSGVQAALEGKFEDKYAYSLVGKFLEEVI